jgi:homoserine dehydrogenase
MASALKYLAPNKEMPVAVCKIAIVGFGTVGSAVARLLLTRNDEHPIELTHIYNRNVSRKKVDWVPDTVVWTEDIDTVLGSDVDVVVELMGGIEPANQWIRRALLSGKSVVTANKQLIAHHGVELRKLAREQQQHLAYGASVAGGVPVLGGLHDGLGGDRLHRIFGVLNGTCNYILTRIERTGASFAEALAEAQKAGFAEADPTDDVDGFDARAKLVILAQEGLNARVEPSQIPCKTIRSLAKVDFDYAHQINCTIRQVSRAELKNGKLYASIGPALVSRTSPIASTSGSQNMVVSSGEFGGEIVFSGAGAGGDPTAVAVVSDLLHVVRYRDMGIPEPDRPPLATIEVSNDFVTPQYVRFTIKDRPGVIAELSAVFARHGLNIDSVLQKPECPKDDLPFLMTFEACPESQLTAALEDVSGFDFLQSAPVHMPILG